MVKRISVSILAKRIAASECQYFHARESERDYLNRFKRRHEIFLRKVKSILSEKGYGCVEEIEVDHHDIKGRIDLLCKRGDELLVIEVKSYSVEKATLKDLYQLITYFYILKSTSDSEHRSVQLYLVYKEEDAFIGIVINNPELLVESILTLREEIASDVSYDFVLGPWCYLCDNKDCPYSVK